MDFVQNQQGFSNEYRGGISESLDWFWPLEIYQDHRSWTRLWPCGWQSLKIVVFDLENPWKQIPVIKGVLEPCYQRSTGTLFNPWNLIPFSRGLFWTQFKVNLRKKNLNIPGFEGTDSFISFHGSKVRNSGGPVDRGHPILRGATTCDILTVNGPRATKNIHHITFLITMHPVFSLGPQNCVT